MRRRVGASGAVGGGSEDDGCGCRMMATHASFSHTQPLFFFAFFALKRRLP